MKLFQPIENAIRKKNGTQKCSDDRKDEITYGSSSGHK